LKGGWTIKKEEEEKKGYVNHGLMYSVELQAKKRKKENRICKKKFGQIFLFAQLLYTPAVLGQWESSPCSFINLDIEKHCRCCCCCCCDKQQKRDKKKNIFLREKSQKDIQNHAVPKMASRLDSFCL